jgi:UDP-glucose 4-epimerase/GDP-4-dehydro-6-deoxy-D-mannose reductase
MPARLYAVKASNPIGRASFVPEYSDYAALRGHAVGLTGARGILGGILKARLDRRGIETAAYPGDVNNGDALSTWFADHRFRYFFHFAALVPVAAVEGDPLLAYQTNVVGTFNVCKPLLETQPGCWLFHCSSSHVYQPTSTATPINEDAPKDPPTFYGATKLAAERVVETLMGKLLAPYCIGRVFSFTHAHQSPPYLVPSLRQKIAALRDGEALEIDNPSSVRDIQDAEQVIDAILHLAHRAAVGTINIGTGIGRSVDDIARSVAQALDKKIQVTGIDRGNPGSLIADITRLRTLLAPVGEPRGR